MASLQESKVVSTTNPFSLLDDLQSWPPYTQWGGFAAAIGALPDLLEARAADKSLDSLLAKLDLIEAAPRTLASLVDTVISCDFSIEELNRLNSPLLDGLVATITGRPSVKTSVDVPVEQKALPMDESAILERAFEHYAHVSTFKLLAEFGVNMHAQVEEPLRNACARGMEEVAEWLLERGAELDSRARLSSPLSEACASGYGNIVRLLIARGVDVSARSDIAVRNAARNGHAAVVALLADAGVDLNNPTLRNDMLKAAIKGRHYALLCLLLERGLKLPRTFLPLVAWCVSQSMLRFVKLLIQQPVFKRDDINQVFIHACKRGQLEAAQLILEAGADIRAREDRALRTAAIGGHLALAHFLLDRGANVHAKKEAPIVRSAIKGHTAMVELLASHGANVNARDGEPLRVAVGRAYVDTVELLLRLGANVHVQNENVLVAAVQAGHARMLSMLFARGAKVRPRAEEILFLAVMSKDRDVLHTVLEQAGPLPEACYGQALRHAEDNQDTEAIALIRSRIESNR